MLWRFTRLSLLVLFVPFAAMAQETETGTTEEAVDEEIQAVRLSIQELKQQQEEMQEQLDELTSMQNELADLQREQAVQQQQVLGSLTKEDSTGQEVLRLSANMEKSPEFRQEMQKAVHGSLEKRGQVIIRNKMATQQRLKVNQTNHEIDAGETLTLEVPVGTLATRLPGQPLVNWAITPPEYSQTIDIVPESETRVTRYRPTENSESARSVTSYRPVSEPPPLDPAPVETYYIEPAPLYWPVFPF
ncbi:MAG: hypothetical protein ACODAD_07725 [Planctomycetota bacterium]